MTPDSALTKAAMEPDASLAPFGTRRYAAPVRIAWLSLVVLLAGCPKDPAVVARSSTATPCTTDADCNPASTTCGLIRACVDLRCEATPTRTVHCP